MKLHYFISKRGNFGDDLNSWIWDNLIPGWQEWDHDVTLNTDIREYYRLGLELGMAMILSKAPFQADGILRRFVGVEVRGSWGSTKHEGSLTRLF